MGCNGGEVVFSVKLTGVLRGECEHAASEPSIFFVNQPVPEMLLMRAATIRCETDERKCGAPVLLSYAPPGGAAPAEGTRDRRASKTFVRLRGHGYGWRGSGRWIICGRLCCSAAGRGLRAQTSIEHTHVHTTVVGDLYPREGTMLELS